MPLLLDHVFILCEPGGAVGDRLAELGLREIAGNVHPGQGTANRRFALADLMLELIWIHDREEAEHGPGAPLRLAERFDSPGASPFGLVFSPIADESQAVPFPTMPYAPPYVPDGKFFRVVEPGETLADPLLVVSPFPASARAGEGPSAFPIALEVAGNSDYPGDERLAPGLAIRSSARHHVTLGKAGPEVEIDELGLTLRLDARGG